MARVTTEDCITKVADRFELVVVSSERAKELEAGTPALIARDHDKNTVIALREIAADRLDIEHLKDNVVLSFRNNVAFKELEENTRDLEFIEKEIMSEIVNDAASSASISTVSEDEMGGVVSS